MRIITVQRIKAVTLVLISIFISLIIFELMLRYFYPETQFLKFRSDSFWRAQLLQNLTHPEYTKLKQNYVYDSNLGWRMRPYYKTDGVVHNSLGFRSSREFELEPHGRRILMIGDSFTYGLGVNNNETFSSYFEKITGVEAINAGVNGYGVDQALLMWELEGKQLKPDIVVLGYFVDDFFRNMNSITQAAKPYFSFDAVVQNYHLLGFPIPDNDSLLSSGILESKGELRSSQALKYLFRKIHRKLNNNSEDEYREHTRLSNYLLKNLNDSVIKSGAKLVVLNIGHCVDGVSEYNFIEASIEQACRINHINCINMAESMRKEDYKSFYLSNCHWSKKGHLFTAKKMAEVLHLD